ncbi:MAG: hypothetical protein U5K81_01265 [Trueperaceae bacterium]|nr:hypothetical protein [Trueperaceae bacterium]
MAERLGGVLASAFAQQPYLGLGMLLLLAAVICSALVPTRPKVAAWAAGAAAPFGLFEYVFYVPEYWAPVQWRLSWVGLADLLFTFAAGGLAWLLATTPCRGRLRPSWNARRVARRFFGCTVLGLLLALLIQGAGLPMYLASLVAMWFGWGCVVWRHTNMRWLGLVGGPAFATVYVLALHAAFALAPEFSSQWNSATLSGITWGGIPVEEIAWAGTFGAVWPSFMAYVLAVRPMGRADAVPG